MHFAGSAYVDFISTSHTNIFNILKGNIVTFCGYIGRRQRTQVDNIAGGRSSRCAKRVHSFRIIVKRIQCSFINTARRKIQISNVNTCVRTKYHPVGINQINIAPPGQRSVNLRTSVTGHIVKIIVCIKNYLTIFVNGKVHPLQHIIRL